MTTDMHIEIDNLKCGGCEKSILKGLSTLEGITGVAVDREHQSVHFTGDAAIGQLVRVEITSAGPNSLGAVPLAAAVA